jgi:hypothetical protein
MKCNQFFIRFVQNKNEPNTLVSGKNNTRIFTRWNLYAKPTKKCAGRRRYLHVDLSAEFAKRDAFLATPIQITSQIRLDTCI